MWNSVCHRRDPSFLSSYILGIFLCLNHFTWSCVNKYELQGFFPVWELTSQEYNKDIQAMNMTHALKMDPFPQRVWVLGLSASFEPLWKPFFVIWKKKKSTSLLPSVRHSIPERFLLSAQTRSVHQSVRLQDRSTADNHRLLASSEKEVTRGTNWGQLFPLHGFHDISEQRKSSY